LSFSDDGQRFTEPVVATGFDDSPDGLSIYQLARRTADIVIDERKTRYVRIGFTSHGEWTFLSEVELNPRASQALPSSYRTMSALSIQESLTQSGKKPPVTRRFAAVNQMSELLNGVDRGSDDEYRVIPSLFNTAIEAGRRNQADEVRAILSFSLPKDQEPLRHWQAVVIGGGLINGISQSGPYPLRRIVEIIGSDASLLARWNRSLELSLTMADDVKVKQGTRYDALRMIAMLPWAKAREPLTRYLSPGTPGELMQGAVSGLADVPQSEASVLLARSLAHLDDRLRELAVAGMTRVDGDTNQLLAAIEAGQIMPKEIAETLRQKMLAHENASVNEKAQALLQQ